MKIPVIKVRQWLPEWDGVDFSKEEYRRKPEGCFYMFTISAKKLKRLSAVYRRSLTDRMSGDVDLGIQRQHDSKRSEEIRKYVKWGYPWSEMSDEQRAMEEFKNLQKPGWLPTSIVVNVLGEDDTRSGKKVAACDLIKLSEDGNAFVIPEHIDDAWKPQGIPPIEIIDGQHRLWSFDESSDDFELPVVAFRGLDISWQAYLFWSINIKPKKINPSLAFDLYPLLRAQDWLEGFNGPIVYREARAQEIVELLWSTEGSPWYHRINMLGERGIKAQVTQAAWIRSLLCTYIKPWKHPEITIGGFYGVLQDGKTVIPWPRFCQAMFLMYLGIKLRDSIKRGTDIPWVVMVTSGELTGVGVSAFESPVSLLNTDQGVRGFLDVTNSILCVLYAELNGEYQLISEDVVDEMIGLGDYVSCLNKLAPKLCGLIDELSAVMARYDWRSYEADFSQDPSGQLIKNARAGFRGSGGYRLIRDDLIGFVSRTAHTGMLKTAVDRIAHMNGVVVTNI